MQSVYPKQLDQRLDLIRLQPSSRDGDDGFGKWKRRNKRLLRKLLAEEQKQQLGKLVKLALAERGWPADPVHQLHMAASFRAALDAGAPPLMRLAERLAKGEIDAAYISNLPQGKDEMALLLLTFTQLIGEPFNYASQNGGKLVMELRPVADAGANTNATTDEFLIHTDDAAMPRGARTEFILLGGVVNPPETRTGYTSTAEAIEDIEEATRAVLRQKRFQVRFPISFGLGDDTWSPPMAILSGSGDDTELRFPSYATRPVDPADGEAAAAIGALKEALNRHVVDFPVDPGTMLVFNNARGAHRRGAIRQGDRLVLRTYAALSLDFLRKRTGVDGPIFPVNPFIPEREA